jgi:hypothetical protein
MLSVLLAFTLAQTAPVHSQTAPADCAYDRAGMLALTPDKFDQDMKGGWRLVADKPGCDLAAADLLAAYRQANWGKLKPVELHINYWHEGQVRAGAGQTERAVPLLLAAVNPENKIGFADYALGSVAFLQRDRAGLLAARARLAKLPKPENWERTQADFRKRFGSAPAWPANLNVLDGLIACFDRPYREAYAPPCTKFPAVAAPDGKPPVKAR